MDAVYVVLEENGREAPRIICVCATEETARAIKASQNPTQRLVSKENYAI